MQTKDATFISIAIKIIIGENRLKTMILNKSGILAKKRRGNNVVYPA